MRKIASIALLVLLASYGGAPSIPGAASGSKTVLQKALSDAEEADEAEQKPDEGNTIDIDDATHGKLIWADSLMQIYINTTHLETVARNRANKINEDWLWDGLVERSGAVYLVLHLGHDVKEGGGNRFATDGWVYIDTASRKMFEYNTVTQKLTEWNK